MTSNPVAYVADPAVAALIGAVEGLTIVTDRNRMPPPEVPEAQVFVPRFLAAGNTGVAPADLPKLRLLQLATAGAEAWHGRVPAGVTLATASGAHGGATAEWAVGALIAVVREFPGFVLAQRDQQWTQHRTDLLAGKRALVIGSGDLGSEIRRRLTALDVEVTMMARQGREGVAAVADVHGLLPTHDVVVLAVPLTTETTGLVDAAFLADMPDGAILVNAARGPVVVTDALVAELSTGRLRAALDVTDPEPLPVGHPLWSAPGVFLTPHVGGSAAGADQRAADVLRRQLVRFVAGEPLQNVVGEAGY